MRNDDYGLTIDSNTNRLAVHFDELLPELQAKLKKTISRLTHQLLGAVKAAEPVRTGRLRAATHAYVDVRKDFIRGRVRIIPTGRAQELGAAFGALEYGGPGQRRAGEKVQVKGYRRRGARIGAYERRQPHIRARRFLRGPAQAMRPQMKAELEAAVGQTLKEFDFSIVAKVKGPDMAASTLNIGTQPEKRGTLIFTGANDIGPQLTITLTTVQINPSAAINVIGDEYGILEVSGEVLAAEDGSFGTVEHPDDTATAPDVGNYYVGTGVVTWTPEATTAVPTPTARDVGNVNVFEFTQAVEMLDHWNHRGGIRKRDFRPVVQQTATVRMVMDEFTAENLRLALLAA